jgi:hypothetical protein
MAKKQSKDTPKPHSARAGSPKPQGQPDLIVCHLPGGVEIVATRESCQAHGGTVVEGAAAAAAAGVGVIKAPIQLVACRLPTGEVIVTTSESCKAANGVVISRSSTPLS